MLRNRLIAWLSVLILIGVVAGSSSAARAQNATPIGGVSSDVEVNKALVMRLYEEVWTGGNTDLLFQILAPDYKAWFGAWELTYTGPEAAKRSIESSRANIPGLRLSPDIVVAEGNHVAVRWSLWASSEPAPFCRGNAIYRVAEGVLAEVWIENGCG